MKINHLEKVKSNLLAKGIFFIDKITSDNIDAIQRWIVMEKSKRKVFTILIDSTGGEVNPVLRFASTIPLLNNSIAINGVTFGHCGSAALALLQCCHKRSAVKHTAFFIHHLSSSFGYSIYGKTKERFESEIESIQRTEDEITMLQCKRTGISREKWCELADKGELARNMFIYPDEALRLNLIDEIIDSYPCV